MVDDVCGSSCDGCGDGVGCGDNDGCRGGDGRGGCSRREGSGSFEGVPCGSTGCGSGLDLSEGLWPERRGKAERRKANGRKRWGCDRWSRATGSGPSRLQLLADRVALGAVPDGVAPRPVASRYRPRQVGVGTIRLYQRRISPRLPARCRYVPTCSEYGLDAVRFYGLLLGSRLALGRIRRCTRTVPSGTRDLLRV